MRFKKLGNTDLNVSVIGAGTWAIGGDFWGPADDKNSIETLRTAIDAGVTLVDTAPAYGRGHAEKIVGEAIKGVRDKVILATKCAIRWDDQTSPVYKDCSPEYITYGIDKSLKNLGVDTIDLMQIHWPEPVQKTPFEDTMAALMKAKDQGKIRYIGVSNFSPAQMDACRKAGEVVSIQPQFSLIYRDEQHLLEYAKAHGMGVLTYGSLGSGVLSGKYKELPKFGPGDNRANFYDFFQEPKWSKCMQLVEVLRSIAADHNVPVGQVAINWTTQNDLVTSALVGMRTPEQALQNVAAANWELSEKEIAYINSEYDRIFAE
ncbi:aldo/keto reductase [Zongyangia hominis]|uniref:Aldo/keto reductase n=1 Tax=Zongyangia hominis TaxID=2763677 RepID=A0A926ECK6_9FIRM|nr:aldo/keto reductase [Zongyangia hominis]MBC8570595.1 aldo/keto reductase [Zongyangia hominis]